MSASDASNTKLDQPETYQTLDQIVNSIKGKTWIEKLKTAFVEGSGSEDKEISLEQWRKSNLKYLIEERILSDEEMVETFQQIDANIDSNISWADLVAYLMMHQKSLSGATIEKKIRLSFSAPDALTIKKTKRSSVCLRARYIPQLEQILTLTETTLTFWTLNCVPIRSFTDRDKFVDFCCLQSIFKLAIAKQNRQIIFYDLRTHAKLDYFISATLETNSISHYNPEETRNAISNCRRRRIPLFNTPTAIESENTHPYLFVGDQEGRIEVFSVHASRAGKSEWGSTRIKCMKMHNQAVSQITYIPQLDVFTSSSLDGTIAIWNFSFKSNELKIETKFTEPSHLPITSFVYEHRTRDYLYTTPSHCFGIWRTGMSHSQVIETNQELISTMSICSLSSDSSFLVAVTKNNFFIVYRLPNMELCGNWFMGLQHELCPPTASLSTNGYLYLVGAFISGWRIENGTGDGIRACQNNVANVQINDLFKKILTCDRKAIIASWDLISGKKEFGYGIEEKDADVTSFTLDLNQRRAAVGYSNGIVHIVTANSGSVLSTIEKGVLEGGCLFVCFAKIFSHKKFLCATGNKTVVLFDDLEGNKISFHRNFVGHSENVIKIAVLKDRVIVTVGNGHEMFLWTVQQQNPIIKFALPNDPTIAVDIPNNDSLFIAGDVNGFLYIMKIDCPTPLKKINVFGMSIKSAITSVVLSKTSPLVLIGNMHGYVRAMYLMKDYDLDDIKMFRAHSMEILNISLSEAEKIFTTVGIDQEVKLWTLEPFSCIGSVGKLKKWKLTDQSTWLGDKTVEIDQTHFLKPEDIVPEEEEEIIERKVVTPPPPLPPPPDFTLEGALRMLDTTEDEYIKGEKLIKKIKTELATPKSARVVKPVVPKMSFADLIENRHMTNTIGYVKSCRAIEPRNIKDLLRSIQCFQ